MEFKKNVYFSSLQSGRKSNLHPKFDIL